MKRSTRKNQKIFPLLWCNMFYNFSEMTIWHLLSRKKLIKNKTGLTTTIIGQSCFIIRNILVNREYRFLQRPYLRPFDAFLKLIVILVYPCQVHLQILMHFSYLSYNVYWNMQYRNSRLTFFVCIFVVI